MSAIDLELVYPLTDFLRNHVRHVERLKKSKDPAVFTVNGKAEVVMLDVKTYQEILEKVARVKTVEAIRIGLIAADEGRMKPAEKVFEEIKAKYGIRD